MLLAVPESTFSHYVCLVSKVGVLLGLRVVGSDICIEVGLCERIFHKMLIIKIYFLIFVPGNVPGRNACSV